MFAKDLVTLGTYRGMMIERRHTFKLLAVALLLGSPALAADEKPKFTVANAMSLLSALRNLDGRMVVVKQGGVDTTIMSPWDFSSGTLRLRIARNVTALARVEQDLENARQAMVKEIQKTLPAGKDTIQQGTPEWDRFQQQYSEALNAAAQVDLVRIKASELKLDKNEIPITALSALGPILDDDVTK